jgi:hypothetical protein
MEAATYYVQNECILGYVYHRAQPNTLWILRASVIRGAIEFSGDPCPGSTVFYPERARRATFKDFDDYRVCVPSHLRSYRR